MQTRTTSKCLHSGVKNNVCKLILSPIAIEFIFLYFVFTVKLYRNIFHLFNVFILGMVSVCFALEFFTFLLSLWAF